MWANVPDPPGESGWSALVGFTEASTRCPHCRKLIAVSVGTDGGIRNISYKSEDCLLTTACCTTKGLPDDCLHLRSARALRGSWLSCQPSGEQIISLYYRVAPHILSGLHRKLTARSYYELMDRVFSDYIEPSAAAWEQGKPEVAFGLLRDMVEHLALAADVEVKSFVGRPIQRRQARTSGSVGTTGAPPALVSPSGYPGGQRRGSP